MSFTPGPWTAVKRIHPYDMDLWDVSGPSGEMLAGGTIYHEGPANAHLIAAAPELYGALELLIKWGAVSEESEPYWPEIERAARAALAKARGES